MEQQNKQTLMIRMDKNIISNGIDFVRNYKKDSSLIFDIVLHVGQNYQEDLFGYEDVEIYDFCDNMGYLPKNLKKTHPDPMCYHKVEKFGNGYDFSNYFENALFRMMADPMVFSKKVEDHCTGDVKIKMKSYQLLTDLEKHIYKRKDRYKYSFKFNDVLRQHINLFFGTVDVESLKQLRKPKAVFLYLKLIELQDLYEKGETDIKPSFDDLCNQAQIDIKDYSDRKKKLKYKLDLINERSELDFSSKFYNKSGKHNFGVQIEFNKVSNPLNKNDRLKSAFKTSLTDNLIKVFRETYNLNGRLNTKKFNEWLSNPAYEQKEKMNCYFTTKSIVYRMDIASVKKYSTYDANTYFQIRK